MKNTNYKREESGLSRREFLWKTMTSLWIMTSWGIAEVMSSCKPTENTPTPLQIDNGLWNRKNAIRNNLNEQYGDINKILSKWLDYDIYIPYPDNSTPENFFGKEYQKMQDLDYIWDINKNMSFLLSQYKN